MKGVSLIRKGALGMVVTATTLFSAVCVSSDSGAATTTTPNASSSAGVSKAAIKIGLLTSISGAAASSFGQPVVDGVQAALSQVNDNGGVNGRKLRLVIADDGSSPTQALTATQSLVSQGVYGIVVVSSFFFSAYRYAVQQGIPVAGIGIDGPEWGSSANYNLFGAFGSIASTYPTFTTYGKFFKRYGGTVLGVVAYGASPSSAGIAKATAASAQLAGVRIGYEDLTAAIGSTNFTADALAMKQAGVNAIATGMVTSSNIALIEALKQDGVSLKAELIGSGYQQAILDQPASLSAAQGISFQSKWAPSELKTPATKSFMSALAKYANYHEANPQQGQAFGWFTAQTFIKGVQVAGKHPTWGSFITGLRKVTNYTANGMIAPVNYAKFGNVDPNSAGNCWYQSVVKGSRFVALSTKPFCGAEVAGTSNA